MAALRGVVTFAVISLSLSLCCVAYRLNNEETDREYLRRELNKLEYDLEVKGLLDELKSMFDSPDEVTSKVAPTTASPPAAAATTLPPAAATTSPPPVPPPAATTPPPVPPAAAATTSPPVPPAVATEPKTTPKLLSAEVDVNYIQHVVNCYRSYRFVTERGLSERDNIYNIVNVQCMADPRVERLVKLLTAYYYYKLSEDNTAIDPYDAVGWLFSVFLDDDDDNVSEEDKDNDTSADEDEDETSDEVDDEDVTTFNPTTAVNDQPTSATTAIPDPTTLEQQTTVPVNNNIEENDEEAVRELLLQRVLMMLKKDKHE